MSETDPFSSKKDFPLGGHYHALDSIDASGLTLRAFHTQFVYFWKEHSETATVF